MLKSRSGWAKRGAALAFRNLVPLSDADQAELKAYGKRHNQLIYLQPGGPDSLYLIYPESSTLSYRIDAFDVAYQFLPTDFTQVNRELNQKMVAQALELLDPQADESVLDLFCGLGNFSLPLARLAGSVYGVEGDQTLVERAKANAAANNLTNIAFEALDLTVDLEDQACLQRSYDKVLIDPPRTGALELMALIPRLNPKKIVYVSCHPGSLARDAGVLVKEHGYRMTKAGVMDMFPHTAHVESIAVFEKA